LEVPSIQGQWKERGIDGNKNRKEILKAIKRGKGGAGGAR
jgi:hypothetical protein